MAEYTAEEIEKIKLCIKKCRSDFMFLCKNFLKIQTRKDTKIANLVLNNPQKILHTIIEKHIKPVRPVRIVILKARRMGFSTYISARFYSKTAFNRNRYTAQITHEPEATDTLFKMVKRFYDLSPKYLRPEIKYNNSKLLEFNTKNGDGLGSAFRVATAGKEDYGSGQAIHYLHLSETSKWATENATSLLTSIMQTVPNDEDTEVVFESTAKGIGGEFHDRFWSARYRIWVSKMDADGNPVIVTKVNSDAVEENRYTSIFMPWFCFEDYTVPAPKSFKLLEWKDDQNGRASEVVVKEKYGLTNDQIYWRRLTLANECNGSEDKFNQEYPDSPEVAFLSSGRPVFDNVKVASLRDIAPAPIKRYNYEFDLTGTNGAIVPAPLGRLLVWEEPAVGEHYIIGADVAEGLAHGDSSHAHVINHRTGQQVACWHGKADPDQFARILSAIGYKYNTAFLAPERNNHGLMVVTLLQGELRYPDNRIYVERVAEPPGPPRKRYGWQTSNLTRPLIIDNLIREVREGTHGIRSSESLSEMLMFKVQKNGRMEADSGQHDDRVMAMAIAKYVRQTTTMPHTKRSSDRPHPRGTTGKRVSRLAWT
jgi:hypothetical protein